VKIFSASAFFLLALAVASVYLPELYDMAFFEPVEKTHLLYSPVSRRFVYTEKIVGPIPPQSTAKAQDHHDNIAYRDEDGGWYTRVEFEKMLPTIYYKNMEIWGLLPLRLEGRVLDRESIERHRLVLELGAGEVSKRHPEIPLWPLLESNPKQARLVFPPNRFRMRDDAMEFVDADVNRVDEGMTSLFTGVLKARGFVFPARSVHGRFTVLKPFDEGVFIVDARYGVFHVKRVDGQPVVVKLPLPPSIHTRQIVVAENNQRKFYGLLLDEAGGMFLLSCDNYRTLPLHLEGYDPDRMDFKLLMNPLFYTAVYSDDAIIHARVMDHDLTLIAEHSRTMSRALPTTATHVRAALFPFTLSLKADPGGYLRPHVILGGWTALPGMAASLILFVLFFRLRGKKRLHALEYCAVALTGVYGLLILAAMGRDSFS